MPDLAAKETTVPGEPDDSDPEDLDSVDKDSVDEDSDDEDSHKRAVDSTDSDESSNESDDEIKRLKNQLNHFETAQETQHREIEARFNKLESEINTLLEAHNMATAEQQFTLSPEHESELQEIWRQLICDRCLLIKGDDLDKKLNHIKTLLLLRVPAQ